MRNLIKATLGSLVIASSLFVITPAQAATAHCNATTYPNKVELSGDNASVDTNLTPGTMVCLKIGNVVVTTTVGADGLITNPGVYSNNELKGISYYAYGSGPYNPYGS